MTDTGPGSAPAGVSPATIAAVQAALAGEQGDTSAAAAAAASGQPAPVLTPSAPAPVVTPAAPAPAAPVVTPPPAAPAATDPAPAVEPKATPPSWSDVDTTGWPAEAVAAFQARDADARRYQNEAAGKRIANKDAQAAVRALAVQAGIELPPDPNAVPDSAQVTEAFRAERFDGALAHAALQHGIPAAQLDYAAFKLSRNEEAKALDPTASDYRARLSAIVQGEIQRDASLLGAGTQQQQVASVQDLGGAAGNANLTADAWGRMSPLERAQIYTTDKATYDRLVTEESAAGRR